MSKTNGWSQYKKLFERLIDKVDSIDDKVEIISIKMGKLEERSKVMSALYGGLGAGIAIIITLAVRFLG